MYYVYKTTNTVNNKIYVGVHKSDNIQSDQYLGSGEVLKTSILKYGREMFKRQILYQYQSEQDAYLMQFQIVDKQFIKRRDTYNIRHGGKGGLTEFVSVKDKNGRTFSVSKDDPRYLSGQLVGVNKGKVVVKDKNGTTSRISTNDPRYLSGEMAFIQKGLARVKDQYGKVLNVQLNDPRYLSGQLVGVNKGNKMPKNHAVGNKNSQYGTIWINNGLVNKKILKCNEIPQGWFRGRINCQVGQKNSQYDTIWITTGFQNKKIKSHQTIPYGWRRGLVKLWKK